MKTKKIKNINIEQSPLYGLSSIDRLLSILGLYDLKEFKSLCTPTNYNVYYKFKTTYKNGEKIVKKRLVEAPDKKLKKVQKTFNKILQEIITPDYVNAGRKKMSYIKNAKEHLDCNDMLCTDIHKFFPHTKTEYLVNFLKNNLKISEEVIELLAELLTLNGHLPTGAPSSPLLTFWCYKETFDKIYDFSKTLNIKMTLYIDDMTFSSKGIIPKNLLRFVFDELQKVNLELSIEKVKRYKMSKYKHTTGSCIDRKHRLLVPNKKRKELIDIIKDKNLVELTQKELKTAIGKIYAMQMQEPKIFQATLKKLLNIQSKFKKAS